MKAVIMAGGEGTRLRPVSLNSPKPMVRLMDRPVLAHILELLGKNGITEACLTLKYLPGIITDYLSGGFNGMNLHTRIEQEALGTAGGVKGCSDFIGGDDFIVISGDCVCDFDLNSLINFHREKNACVTIALYEHPEPLEYGLVVTREDGRIERFVEKPPWENVVTNRINTGIYVISSTVLAEIPDTGPYDFGKDLFPLLLAKNRALYAMPMDGYWCDVGNSAAYLGCCIDMLQGKINANMGAPLIKEGIWSLSPVPDRAEITPPVYIGAGADIKPGAVVGPCSVIGAGSVISRGASVVRSVVGGASISENASVSGAVICKGASIGSGAEIREEAVIGEGCVIGENTVVSQSVKIWPDRQIPAGALVTASITHGMLKGGPVFTAPGVISGGIGAELTAEICMEIGSAAARFGRVGIGVMGGDAARVMSEAFGCGVCADGGSIIRYDCGLPSCASFIGMLYGLALTVSFRQDGERLGVTFFGENGGPLSHDAERKLISGTNSGTVHGAESFGRSETVCGSFEAYAAAAARYAGAGIGMPDVSISGGGIQNRVLRRALELAGCAFAENRNGVACFEASPCGTSLRAEDEDGRQLDPELLLALTAVIEFERGRRELAVPHDAPAAIDEAAARYDAKVYRLGRDGARAEALYTELRSMRDAAFACTLICAYMSERGLTLAGLVKDYAPKFSFATHILPLKRGRGEIMAALSAFACETGAELTGGIKMNSGGGYVYISPMREKCAIRIRGEAKSEEIAEELCADIIRRAKELDFSS